MAITEACQLWIEQRIQEELESQEETGKSLRAIGKEIAKEIERIFQAKVNPGTIKERARRMLVGTNVPPPATLQEDTESGENQSQIKAEPAGPAERLHMATGEKRGGKRKGAGRKSKYGRPAIKPESSSKDEIYTEEFKKAFDVFFVVLKNAKSLKWKSVSREAAMKHLAVLYDLLTIN